MIPVDRVVIRFTWAPETRQVGKVWVVELPAGTTPSIRDPFHKPRFIPESERIAEPEFERGATDSAWLKGDPSQTPAGAFGDMLLSQGFASWEYTRQALLAFTSIEGCDWAKQMLGSFHPTIHDRD